MIAQLFPVLALFAAAGVKGAAIDNSPTAPSAPPSKRADTEPPQDTTPPDKPPLAMLKEELTITFYVEPQNLPSSNHFWWRDLTDYVSQSDSLGFRVTDNQKKVIEREGKSIQVGQMTGQAFDMKDRTYSWLSSVDGKDVLKVCIINRLHVISTDHQECTFAYLNEPGVSDLLIWSDSSNDNVYFEAKRGDEVVGADALEKIKNSYVFEQECHDVGH